MRHKAIVVLVGLIGITGSSPAQVLEALHIDRTSLYYQSGSGKIDPIGEMYEGMDSWYFSTGATFSSGRITNPRIAGPAFPGGREMELRIGEEGIEYDYETGFDSESALAAFSAAGDYLFTGTGDTIGAFTETIPVGTYSPLVPKRITNFTELQAIDPAQPFILKWEPFEDAGEVLGFIEVDILVSWNDGFSEIWESAEDNGFGLSPETSEVEVPAGVLSEGSSDPYRVVVTFTRIDYLVEETGFGPAIKAAVTDTQTSAPIQVAPLIGPVNLIPFDWSRDSCYGWMYGLSAEWGYSHDLGFVWVGFTPTYLYQYPVGWLTRVAGTLPGGIWFHSATAGWMYTREDFRGWYASATGEWHNMKKLD